MTTILGNQDNVLQVVRHEWSDHHNNTTITPALATGSTFSFTPKSATSKLYVTASVDLEAYTSVTSLQTGAGCAIYAGGSAITANVSTLVFLRTNTNVVARYFRSMAHLSGEYAHGTLTPFNIEIYDTYYATAGAGRATINPNGSEKSSITVIEVEK